MHWSLEGDATRLHGVRTHEAWTWTVTSSRNSKHLTNAVLLRVHCTQPSFLARYPGCMNISDCLCLLLFLTGTVRSPWHVNARLYRATSQRRYAKPRVRRLIMRFVWDVCEFWTTETRRVASPASVSPTVLLCSFLSSHHLYLFCRIPAPAPAPAPQPPTNKIICSVAGLWNCEGSLRRQVCAARGHRGAGG
jgi:hypothetical protein